MTLTVDADSPDTNVRSFRNRLTGYNSHIERIDIERIVKEHIVDDVRDIQVEGEAFSTVLAIPQAGSPEPKERYGPSLLLVNVHGELMCVSSSSDIFKLEVYVIR
jgi:hypothetical protein